MGAIDTSTLPPEAINLLQGMLKLQQERVPSQGDKLSRHSTPFVEENLTVDQLEALERQKATVARNPYGADPELAASMLTVTAGTLERTIADARQQEAGLKAENAAWEELNRRYNAQLIEDRWDRWNKALRDLGCTEAQIREFGVRQTVGILVDRGIEPDEITINGMLTDPMRLIKASKLLGIDLTDEKYKRQARALLDAHRVGSSTSGMYKYTREEIEEKKRILREEGEFTREQIKLLLDKGLAGVTPDAAALRETALRGLWKRFKEEEEKEERPFPFTRQEEDDFIRRGMPPQNYRNDQGELVPGALSEHAARLRQEESYEKAYGKRIENFEDLVREIAAHDEAWGPDGKFPLFKVKRIKNGERKGQIAYDIFGKYHIEKDGLNFANFRRWVLQKMWDWHDDSPDEEHNFGQVIGLLRPSGNSYSLNTMLYNKTQFFKVIEEVNGKQKINILSDLVEQLKRDLYMFSLPKNFDIIYRKGGAMASEDELAKLLNSLHADNPFTKKVWEGKSIFYWLFTQPANYITHYERAKILDKDADDLTPEEEPVQDAIIGGASAVAWLVYRNLINIPKLKELLGDDAPLFRREDVVKMRDFLADDKKVTTEQYFGDAEIDKIFGAEVTLHDLTTQEKQGLTEEQLRALILKKQAARFNSDAFINAFNVWGAPQGDVRALDIVRGLIADSLAQRLNLFQEVERSNGNSKDWFVFDDKQKRYVKYNEKLHATVTKVYVEDSLAKKLGEAEGYYNQRWTGGAALNDVKSTAFDAYNRWIYTMGYRDKQGSDGRGGFRGNDFNLFMVQRAITDFLTGTRTEFEEYLRYEKETTDQWGRSHKKGAVVYKINPKTGEFLYEYNRYPEDTPDKWDEKIIHRKGEIIYKQDPATGKVLKDDNGKPIPWYEVLRHPKDFVDRWGRKHEKGEIVYQFDPETGEVLKDSSGKPIPLEDKRKIPIIKTNEEGIALYKTPLRVIEEIAMIAIETQVDKDFDVTEITAEIHSLDRDRARWLRDVASQMMFAINTQQKYSADFMLRGAAIFKILMGGHKLKFKDFMHRELTLSGLRTSMDTVAFGEAFQEKFMKPFRYGYSTWGQLDYTQRIPVWVEGDKKKGTKGHYEDKYLVEAMFGKEILDAPEFWKEDYKTNEYGQILYKHKDGSETTEKGKDGEKIVLRVHPHEIDVAKIQNKEGKVRLFKRVIMGYIAAQIYAHRTRAGREKLYTDLEMQIEVDTILDALSRIPNGLEDFSKEFGDVDMKTIFPTETFFTREDIAWIREHSLTGNWRLFGQGLFWGLMRALLGIGKDFTKGFKKEFKLP